MEPTATISLRREWIDAHSLQWTIRRELFAVVKFEFDYFKIICKHFFFFLLFQVHVVKVKDTCGSFVGQGINCLQQKSNRVSLGRWSSLVSSSHQCDLLISRKNPKECARYAIRKQSFILYSQGDWLISLWIYQSNFFYVLLLGILFPHVRLSSLYGIHSSPLTSKSAPAAPSEQNSSQRIDLVYFHSIRLWPFSVPIVSA